MQAAASSQHVAYSDPQSLIYSALLASSVPDWFESAVPAEYKTQVGALEGVINTLKGSVTAAPGSGSTLLPVIIPVTTTDSAGSIIVESVTSSQAVAIETVTTGGVSTERVAPVYKHVFC